MPVLTDVMMSDYSPSPYSFVLMLGLHFLVYDGEGGEDRLGPAKLDKWQLICTAEMQIVCFVLP